MKARLADIKRNHIIAINFVILTREKETIKHPKELSILNQGNHSSGLQILLFKRLTSLPNKFTKSIKTLDSDFFFPKTIKFQTVLINFLLRNIKTLMLL